jgi:ankyrin repeat protein
MCHQYKSLIVVLSLLSLFSIGCSRSSEEKAAPMNLIDASKFGFIATVRQLLATGVDLNAKDTAGITALGWASLNGHTDVVKALIDAKPDLNSKDKDGVTALMNASVNGHTEAVKALLAAKPDLNSRNRDGVTALMNASVNGHTEAVKALLAAKPDLNSKDKDGMTALMKAAMNGHVEAVKALLAAKPDLNSKNRDGVTALRMAYDKGHTDVLKLLVSQPGAKAEVIAIAAEQRGREANAISAGPEKTRTGGGNALNEEQIEYRDTPSHLEHAGASFVSFSPNRQFLASGSRSSSGIGEVKVWNVKDGKCIRTLDGVGPVLFTSQGTLITGGERHSIRCWRIHDGRVLRTFIGHQDTVTCIDVARRRNILVSGSEDHTIKLWNASDGTLLMTLNGGAVTSVSFSPDETLLASRSVDGTTYLWRVNDGKLLDSFSREGIGRAVKFSPDGKGLALGTGRYTAPGMPGDGEVELCRLDGETVTTLPQGNQVLALAFSQDGSVLASYSTTDMMLWRTSDFKLVQTFKWQLEVDGKPYVFAPGKRSYFTIALSYDDRLLAAGFIRSVQIWKVDPPYE